MSSTPDEGSAPLHLHVDTARLSEDEGDVSGLMEDDDDADTVNGREEPSDDKMLEYLQEARNEETEEGMANGITFRKFKPTIKEAEDIKAYAGADTESDIHSVTNRPPSLTDSTPDDTPSLHGSITSSSLAGSARFSPAFSPSPSLRPFDRRFQTRLTPSSPSLSPSPRALSPSFLGHSRNGSIGSRLDVVGIDDLDDRSAPWEVVRWTKLTKITNQVFSEAGRRSHGNPTCIAISATIAVGTEKGLILVFDYSQVLKSIIGSGTKAIECGAVTALAVSADHTTIAGGHANGHIFTWELAKHTRPFLQIAPIPMYEMENRKADGHVEGVAVLHLGFLGTRHTALVSADDRGMAFSHLATRGLGAVGRMVKTTRILGRYPTDAGPTGRPRKPSSVLGLSFLPLGNSQERTDSMGLVAMLTPYLLVIVSTTPIAQTQYKTTRPKEVAVDSALSGCLAWYPAVKLKQKEFQKSKKPTSSKARLVYVWSNVLTLLELSIVDKDEPDDSNRPPTLEFRPKSRFRCDEAIVAVQWISRQIIGVLTVTQRLIILEDTALRITETFDLMPKHILHRDLFSRQLDRLVNRMDEEGSLHPHVADAFYNSFKAYKGRMFLLCNYEMASGALSNWADRLLAMMKVGDFIGAIRLATAYYIGDTNKLTIGLPEDPALRHPMVEEKLLEMMTASLRYAFGKNQNSSRKDVLDKTQLQELAAACFEASLSMDRTDFLFDDAFEHFEQASLEGVFLETLEPHILERQISFIPPIIVKALIAHYTSLELESRLEEMICHMDTRTLDIDQVTTLCKKHSLYDAMIYVWNRALGDYITPMIDLLTLLLPLVQHNSLENGDSIHAVNALKLFPYLSYTLTGRVYPTGEDLTEVEASNAKAQIYYFLFLGQTVTWPQPNGKSFFTMKDPNSEPSFPYLRLILQFDASSFLGAMNEAFEDSFLNGVVDNQNNGGKQEPGEDQVFGRSVNRQYIISILLEVMNPNDFPTHDTIYLDMFVARNLPKFPQFILLSGSSLHRVLVGLCNPPGDEITDDCQLSVEYLLTVYRPPDIDDLIEHFSRAGFFRVLKTIFRSEKQYAKLLRVYFEDDEALEAVFGCIAECLRPRSGLTDGQIHEVKTVIEENARKLLEIDESRTSRVIDSYVPELHHAMLTAIEDKPHDQFVYLRTVLEPTAEKHRSEMKKPAIMQQNTSFVEAYIRLMCQFDPNNVSEYVSLLQSGDLRLEKVLPAMEGGGAMDAAVVLMAREGQIRQAMDRLVAHLETLETALISVLDACYNVEDVEASNEAAKETLKSLQKYARVGVWLCQGQMKSGNISQRQQPARRRLETDKLTQDEILWLDLVDVIVRIAKRGMTVISKPQTNGFDVEVNGSQDDQKSSQVDSAMLTVYLRKFVQDTFSSLLAATSNSQTTSFLHILRAFLARASLSSPSLENLRSVLSDIFEAYLYEAQLLSLANRLLDKDLFIHVEEAASLRKRGWKPATQSCEACRKKIWGPGAAGGIYSAWEKTRLEEQRRLERQREQRRIDSDGSLSAVARGKSRATEALLSDARGGVTQTDGDAVAEEASGGLVLFGCRHIYHRKCVDNLQVEPAAGHDWACKCIVCGHVEVH
ncbi:Golgi CORVET complex core vacuolar protein 8-domain-containing protein [Geopyxis carbonaria]|nr:Golgi CORVET complex core vacuolar protein 8-domain-containing protein [Geopyxis carbonaria]